MPTKSSSPSSQSPSPLVLWRVRDAAESLLAGRRRLADVVVPDGGGDNSRPRPPTAAATTAFLPLSHQCRFGAETSMARIRRDKTPTVLRALDAAAGAVLESTHKADDDDDGDDRGDDDAAPSLPPQLPPLLDDIVRLQELRVASLERALDNKDLAKRKAAFAKEQQAGRPSLKHPPQAQQQQQQVSSTMEVTKRDSSNAATATAAAAAPSSSSSKKQPQQQQQLQTEATHSSPSSASKAASPSLEKATAPQPSNKPTNAPPTTVTGTAAKPSSTGSAKPKENTPTAVTSAAGKPAGFASVSTKTTTSPSKGTSPPRPPLPLPSSTPTAPHNKLPGGSQVSTPEAAGSSTTVASTNRNADLNKPGGRDVGGAAHAVATPPTTTSMTTSTPPRTTTSTTTIAAPPKFTRNTPASSAAALEARLTSSRAILCAAANVTFHALTPPPHGTEEAEVDSNSNNVNATAAAADVPQNPNSAAGAAGVATAPAAGEEPEGEVPADTPSKGSAVNSHMVTNMGAVLVEAQTLGQRIEATAANAARRSQRRFRYRKDDVLYNDRPPGGAKLCLLSGYKITKNPFAWTPEEEEEEEDADDADELDYADGRDMDIDDDSSTSSHCPNGTDAGAATATALTKVWTEACVPRLLSILQTGVGHALLHDVMWSTRHARIANLLQELASGTDNYGPHLIVTVGPDVGRYARHFGTVNSHLRLMRTVDETSLRALPYTGAKSQRRRLRRRHFPTATGLSGAPFHVVITSYKHFIQDYIHFCQFPFEVVLMDDGLSWMAAANGDPNSSLSTIWDDALFSKSDHHMGLAGTSRRDWDYGQDADRLDEEALKDALIGLTARHRLVTSSRARIPSARSAVAADLLPVSGLVGLVAPHFATAVREEWDRCRITGDAASMGHFRKLLARSTVVHHPQAGKRAPFKLAMDALNGDLVESVMARDPPILDRIPDESFVADGKVANSRRSALLWLGSIETSWLRYELGAASFAPIMEAMKHSGMYGHICEEIITASLTTTAGATGQIAGGLAYRLAVRCGRCFGSEQGLRQHLSTLHAPPGTWLCRACGADCITSQARTHHERSCGQLSYGMGLSDRDGPPVPEVASSKGVIQSGPESIAGKKKGRLGKTMAPANDEKDADGSIRVPSYRGVWVDQAGKFFVKIKSERLVGANGKTAYFNNVDEAAKKFDAAMKKKDASRNAEYNFKPNGSRIVYEDVSTASTTGLGGSASNVVPALSVINIKDLPPDVKPLLRDPRQTSRTGGNSKRHVYAYRGVCRQARKGHDRWQSQISFLGVNHYLGTFDSEWDAAAIYAWAHLILYGEEATKQAQKEGEEAAAAYEREKRDIAAGKVLPDGPPKAEKKSQQRPKKAGEKTDGVTTKVKDKVTRVDNMKATEKKQPAKNKRPASNDHIGGDKKRVKMNGEKESIAHILVNGVSKSISLAPCPQFAAISDVALGHLAAHRLVSARDMNYCLTDIQIPAPVDFKFRPCVPLESKAGDLEGGAMLLGVKPSHFGWNVDSILSKQFFTSDKEASQAASVLAADYDENGLNEKFCTLIQGTVTIIGCASSRMLRAYAALGLKTPPVGGPIGPIDCNVGGSSKCCSEIAALIRFVPTKHGDFQFSVLSSDDLITLNGQRITPELGSFPLFNEDICTVGSRVFVFLLPGDEEII